MEIVNQKVIKYDLSLQLETFEIDNLKPLLTFSTIKEIMTPIEYKILLMKLFADKSLDKKKLIIIELPELFANPIKISEFTEMVNEFVKKGIRFIIITQENISKNENFVINQQIINRAKMEHLKFKVVNELPFVCKDRVYDEAIQELIKAVDNFNKNFQKPTLTQTNNEAIQIIQFVILKHLNIKVDLEFTRISPNLAEYIKSYS